MALHQVIQRVLLIGVRLDLPRAAAAPPPPEVLQPLIDAVEPVRAKFDLQAMSFGNRYRSGFWAIYLLSAVAVLCAVLPLGLGWDDSRHSLHPFIGIWAILEVVIICVVASIYWLGHRRDWQGQWLRARTTAELIGYLPLLAPIVDFSHGSADADWYLRVFDPGQHLREARDVAATCLRLEPLARERLTGAWSDPKFVSGYAQWTVGVLEGQRRYHTRVALREKALQHRVHSVNTWLFGLTALGALTHLVLHALWLSLVTTFFPALGASLHGALAQSEAYRLGAGSERLAADLQGAIGRISAVRAVGPGADIDPAIADGLKESIEAALALIIEEHQDWHMLVRPHHLPLA
ncbi:MAG: hypothetical protein ABSD02_09305 [Steroidobacteraceae bacterium]|jgi:hypothetical protein